eukprot:15338062-Ditylum_brightwellii.AAC.1
MESTGLLAMGAFTKHCIIYHQISTTSGQNLFYYDNSIFQNRLSQFFNGEERKAADYLMADTGVQMQVEETFAQLNLSIASFH